MGSDGLAVSSLMACWGSPALTTNRSKNSATRRSLGDLTQHGPLQKVLGFNGPQSEELARRSSQNLQAVAQASSVLARGAQEVSREVIQLVQDRLQKNVEAVSRLASTRSVQDFGGVQSGLARDGREQGVG